mmetsp:Transcript_111432/g.279028  ORF Transcript_111432/g.279028 Transcript_111432/m.279028 type:complete len:895 (-) Transcript_111432:98-2782(-)
MDDKATEAVAVTEAGGIHADGCDSSNVAALAPVGDDSEVSAEVYLGVVKSYNDRRGFGFLACAETAAHYGRDVYMPKAEATLAAAEAAAAGLDGEEAKAAAAAAAEAAVAAATVAASGTPDKEKTEKPPPAPRLAEEDLVLFRVRLSVEGYPQAACVKKLRKLSGVVARLPTDASTVEDVNMVEGCDAAGHDGGGGDSAVGGGAASGLIESAGAAEAHGMREVPWGRSACGQVRLAVGDEVTFCVPDAPEVHVEDRLTSNGNDGHLVMDAQMIFLSKTARSTGSVLGCFTLDLPRTGGGEDIAPRPNLLLDCHAFGDKLILAGLPADLEEPELMRFFSKQGASQAIVARARTCSFASVSFPGTVEVARFLGRTAHAFADDKETRIARLLALAPSTDTARLPALPAPTLAAGEETGSLLVVWSPLVLAVAYAVELRPAGVSGAWVTVDVASNRLGNSSNRFDSSCSSCKVAGLQPTTAYEARVSYFTECGTRSEASEASDACVPAPTAQHAASVLGTGIGLGAAEVFGATAQHGYGLAAGDYGSAYASSAPLAGQTLPPAPPAWPAWPGPDGLPAAAAAAAAPPMVDGFAPALPAYIPSPGWRSVSGLVVPPPPAPELQPADEHGFAVSIQWPAVVQAAAYVVELREAGSTAFERFVRAAPETKLGTLVELRVGGLRPGPAPGRVYVAQVRTVGADGSESAPSPPGWSPPLPALPAGSSGTPTGTSATGTSSTAGATPASGSMLSADAAPWQPLGGPSDNGTAALAMTATSVAASTSSAAPPAPPVVPPPAAPPTAPCMGNWAAPPWLSPSGPGGGTALGPLGASDLSPGAATSACSTAGFGGGMPPGYLPQGAYAGGPPPPPAGPPPLVQAGQRREDGEPPPEVTGSEECLILD